MIKVDGEALKPDNITRDDYDLKAPVDALNYNKDKGIMDIQVHGFSKSKQNVFKIIQIKRQNNKKQKEAVQCDKEITVRNFSNIENWEGGVVPVGPELIIPCKWRMVMDIEMPILTKLTVEGELIFQDNATRPVQMLIADTIHIKPTGILTAGNEFQYIVNTTINIIADKGIINEGSLNLFGGHLDSTSPSMDQ